MRLLVVEDEPDLARRLRERLASGGYVIESVGNAEAVFDLPDPQHWAAMVIDLGLPGMSGIDFIRRWRQLGYNTPILVLTARGTWQEKVEGLNAGADDYVVKPVDLHELAARLRSLVRRAHGQMQDVLTCDRVVLDPSARQVRLDGQPVTLSTREFDLLHALMRNAGRVLSREQLEQQMYSWGHEVESNTIEVHIHHLRRKLHPEAIQTVRGVGYTMIKAPLPS